MFELNVKYSDQVLDHFKNPRNIGELKDANGLGEIQNPSCHDLIYIYIKVGKNGNKEEIIQDISFQTFGCGTAIATSSMVTVLAKGKTLKEALNISKKDVSKALGGLSKEKMHCSNLATEALKSAIQNYLKKNKTN